MQQEEIKENQIREQAEKDFDSLFNLEDGFE